MPYDKVDKPLVVYRFSGNVRLYDIHNNVAYIMTKIVTSAMRFQSNLNVIMINII